VSVIQVSTPSATYEVTIAPGILRTLYPRLQKLTPKKSPRYFVITSPNIWTLWSKAFLKSFPTPPEVLFLPPGESHKRLPSVEKLAQQLALAGADRDALLIAFGGGVLGDITGFLAAIYMRGIPYVQLPTTLLAQVDSSVGGKTGVNLAAGKNLIGSFHHPLATLVDPETILTLPPAELRSGLQESIKSAIIRDPNLFRYLEKHAPAILAPKPDLKALTKVITASIQVKATVVNQDERENGVRMILNFGHTIGHAIEAATGYKQLLHGQAVGWGQIAALHVALSRATITQKLFDRMSTLIHQYGPLPKFTAHPEKLVALTASDKKRRSGRRAFVLPTNIGATEIVYDVTDPELLTATKSMLETMREQTA
jgi:3-dehydroquinate synthase